MDDSVFLKTESIVGRCLHYTFQFHHPKSSDQRTKPNCVVRNRNAGNSGDHNTWAMIYTMPNLIYMMDVECNSNQGGGLTPMAG